MKVKALLKKIQSADPEAEVRIGLADRTYSVADAFDAEADEESEPELPEGEAFFVVYGQE